MSVKKLILVSVGLISLGLSASVQALTCADCTKELACKFSYKKKLCARDCPTFDEAVVCGTKVQTPPPVQASQELEMPTHTSPDLPTVEPNQTVKSLARTPSRPKGQRFEKPPVLTEEPTESQKPKVASVHALPPGATKQAGKIEEANQELLLAKAQIEMLKESQKIADECEKMAIETAVMGAKDPEKFAQDRQDRIDLDSTLEIFPTTMKSIFPINPQFCSEEIDPKKMDHQSFVRGLKNQVQTTKTMLSDILTDILGWKELSKVEKYRKSVSGDLRALSSFCFAPIKQLKEAIEHRKTLDMNPVQVKKKGFFGKVAEKFQKDKTN